MASTAARWSARAPPNARDPATKPTRPARSTSTCRARVFFSGELSETISSSTNATDAAPTATQNSEATPSSSAEADAATATSAWPSTSKTRWRFDQSSSDMSVPLDSPASAGPDPAPLAPAPPPFFEPNQPDIQLPPEVSAARSSSPPFDASSSPSSRRTCACASARNNTQTLAGNFFSIASSSGAAPTASGGGHRFVADGSSLLRENHPCFARARALGLSLHAPRTYAAYAATYARRARIASTTRSSRRGTAVTFPFLRRSRVTAA